MSKFLLPILYPLSILYGTLIALRNLFYDLGVFTQSRVDAIVISVGNLSVGGTGKTPLVLQLIDLISPFKKNIAVVSRGYGRNSRSPKLYLPFEKIDDWRESGDEPFLLKNRVEELTISIDSDKFRGAAEAVEKGKSELIILDDGFQHRSIRRDLDIVLIEEPNEIKNRLLLPAGRLREPLKSLKRADIVVFMGSEADSAGILKYLNSTALLCGGTKEPAMLIKLNSDEELELSELNGKKLIAFCAVGNPDGFRSTLLSFAPSEVELLDFPDHHVYSEGDLTEIKNKFLSSDSDFLITTEKDALKLPPNVFAEINVYFLTIAFKLTWGKSEFDKTINELVQPE